jgi:hypothetical protein
VNRLQVKDVGAALAEVQEALKGYFDKIGAAVRHPTNTYTRHTHDRPM